MPDTVAERRSLLVAPGQTWASVEQEVMGLALDRRIGRRWWFAFLAALGLVGIMAACLTWLLIDGVGIWGNNNPVVWALDIVAYDWWIGIASGGLLVSALLLLLGAEWRGALNRITETMALVAAAAAGLYPIVHLGRPWFFYWLLPYPNTFQLWPQVRSPLFWDAVDIISFLLVCLSFWYVGLIPDLASMRDRAVERIGRGRGMTLRLLRAQTYGILALGWRGSALHWQRWMQVYRTVGLFGAILVVSLQTGAAVMFAGSVEPGWHDTLLPVTFLCGAVLSGVGGVAVLAVLLRHVFGLGPLVTARHLELIALLLLGLGIATLYCYAAEFGLTSLMGHDADRAVMARRFAGPNAWSTWAVIAGAVIPPHLFWIPRLRRSGAAVLAVGLLAAAGIFADHFMVIVVTLQHDFLPSAAHPYAASVWGLGTFAGSVGLFMALLLLFLRYLPAVSVVEVRRLIRPASPGRAMPSASVRHG